MSAHSEIKKLSVAERILVVEEIWDSIAKDQSALPVTAAQRRELDRRLRVHEASPDDTAPWKAVRARIKKKK
jgi:putative addiction module component (TIGR02574 family)